MLVCSYGRIVVYFFLNGSINFGIYIYIPKLIEKRTIKRPYDHTTYEHTSIRAYSYLFFFVVFLIFRDIYIPLPRVSKKKQ